jgi:hypothetical protein
LLLQTTRNGGNGAKAWIEIDMIKKAKDVYKEKRNQRRGLNIQDPQKNLHSSPKPGEYSS